MARTMACYSSIWLLPTNRTAAYITSTKLNHRRPSLGDQQDEKSDCHRIATI
jgi:hypothetical protein